MFRSILLFMITAVLLLACSSGKTALNRSKFDLAVQKASKRLQQRPGLSKRGHTTAALVLQQAFVQAYEQHQTAIRQLSAPTNTDAFRWESVYREYEQLQTLTDNARRGFARKCDDCTAWLESYPTSYQDRQRNIRELAAADRYEAAEQAFVYREENRLAAKDAYLHYRKAAEWVPDYRQAHGKAADALLFAILRVVVEPLSPTHELSLGDNQELQGLIFRQISRNTTSSTFVRIYTPTEQAGESTPGESTPGESTPGESTPGESTPGESTPGESTPGESTPGESTPGESTPGESTPGESTPGESTPGESTPGESTPGESTPGESTPGESTPGDGFPIHQAVQMQVTDYSPYNESTSSSSTIVYSNQAYKVGEKKINDSTKVDILEKVQGTLTTYQRTIKADLTLRMRALDTQTAKVLWEEPVWESRIWQTEWQTFSGDDRAMNGQALKSANAFPPTRWQLYDSMRDELVGDVARRLQAKYASD